MSLKRFRILLVTILFGAGIGWAQNPARQSPGGYVAVDGSRLYYEECGTGPEAVVLLHDGLAHSAVWDDAWPALCKRYHTIRYDRRGFGRSPETKKPYYPADDLATLLHDRKISHAAIVGSSNGGQVAMQFALRYGEYVSDLVLVGSAAFDFAYSEHFMKRERETWSSDKAPELIDATLRDPYVIVAGHEEAKKRLRAILEAAPQDLTHSDMPLPEKPVLPRVHELRMPVLILIGSGDIGDNHAIAGVLATLIPGAMRVVVPDAGHLMYLEKPDEFFALVDKFLVVHGFAANPKTGGR